MRPHGTHFAEYVKIRSFADWERVLKQYACNLMRCLWPYDPASYLFQSMTLQAKTRNEVAAEYGISTRTLKRWLKKRNINITARDRIPPKELTIIYVTFGNPQMSNDG